ncbi:MULTISPECIES: MerR family transcriptional regulator [unclassified Cocleimonas]|jgi:DNA-binding transcriptional MerR regulator|uniref:MerR family transcriptional regulator n=1 Tax=unclassified Cocleimonas TaxID=2639732 RepID=UPI002619BD2A|nr:MULTISPECIES: MerR family transcriptional regulator [unclassified Cocleimonas]MEB8432753.1 MerR family transcriptional regulator [Cocleimonas sp. KMM 6892]MEC4715612.1 MerR family transcriptional regulator [Cocleimonas sp. KMM 6895]MEC4744770.1 MerR family transcriptional regulator [Cocleimonas sp. KMM 6896]
MMTVAVLAKLSGVTPDAVRYYTRMGLLSPTRNPENGYRQYKSSEVSWLRFIRQAKALGFSLHEIQEIMHDRDEGKSPCPRVRELLQHRIVENRHHLEELLELQDRMEAALEQWSDMPDSKSEGLSVCHLIESFVSPDTETEKKHQKLS